METEKFLLELNKIYKLSAFSDKFRSGGTYNIFVKGGEITIYGSVIQPETKNDMEIEDENVQGTEIIKTIREYIYCEQTSGNVSEIYITGIKAEEI